MSSNSDNQSNADVMEWIAFGGVVVFGLGLAYAIHSTSQIVEDHNKKIIINTETTNVQQGGVVDDSIEDEQTGTTTQN